MGHDASLNPSGVPNAPKPGAQRCSLEDLVRGEGSYPLAAHLFVFEALDYTAKLYSRNRDSEQEDERHVTGQQLLEGARQLALEQFGYMAKAVFDGWGIRETADVGRIVFFLVDHGLMGKTDRDHMADFAEQYDFRKAFDEGFEFRVEPGMDLSQPTPYFHRGL